MKDVDCAYLKAQAPRGMSIVTHDPAFQPIRVSDLVGIVTMATVIAACLGYLFGIGGF